MKKIYHMRLHCLCIAFLLIHPIRSNAQIKQSDYKILDTKNKKELTLEQLTKKLKRVDVVFFGEEHNDSIGHLLEYELLNLLATRYDKVTLSMEMFQSDVQLVLDEYLQDQISETNFKKEAKLWNNYEDYEKIVHYAKMHHIAILAANAPSRYTNKVTREGLESLATLSSEAKALLAPLPIDTLTGAYYEKFSDLMGGHQSLHHINMYQSQNLWDATMAYRISQINQGGQKVLHLTGRFHSDEKLGTYQQLQKYAPDRKLINISCFSERGLEQQDWNELRNLADFVIFTTQQEKNNEEGLN